MSEVSEVSEVLEVSEVTVMSSTPSPFPSSAVGIDFKVLAEEQKSCPDILRLKKSPTLRLVTVIVEKSDLICDA